MVITGRKGNPTLAAKDESGKKRTPKSTASAAVKTKQTSKAGRGASVTAAKKKTSAVKRLSKNRQDLMVDTSVSSYDPIQFPEEHRPSPKTHLTAKQLGGFKDLLLSKRAELAGDVRRLADEALNRKNRGGGENSSMPIHMADLGSDNWEQDFTLGLIANEEALVREWAIVSRE